MSDFECIVVDDGSTELIEPVVAEFDGRFSYVRRDANGGCTAARLEGLHAARGEFAMTLDSDNELFPWALERAAHYLERYPHVDAALGLYVFPDGLPQRIGAGVKVMTPEDYSRWSSSLGDVVGILRRTVVEQWLLLRRDYFGMDAVLMLQLFLSHSVVFVDEPWGRYHTDAATRITTILGRDPRSLDDILRFVDDFRPVIGSTPCAPVDLLLEGMYWQLLRARRYSDARMLAEWMRDRRISPAEAIQHHVRFAVRRRIAHVKPLPVVLI